MPVKYTYHWLLQPFKLEECSQHTQWAMISPQFSETICTSDDKFEALTAISPPPHPHAEGTAPVLTSESDTGGESSILTAGTCSRFTAVFLIS